MFSRISQISKILILFCLIIFYLCEHSLFAEQTNPFVKFSGTLQGRYDHVAEEKGISFNEWKIKRALFSTNVILNRWFRFRIGVNMASQRLMRDVLVNLIFSDNFELKMGQFKIPFSREELNLSSQLLVVDRGETNDLFTANYYQSWDIGGIFIIKNSNDRIHLDIGMFNGQGKNKILDNNDGKALAGRFLVRPRMNVEIAVGSIYNPVLLHFSQPNKTEWTHAYEGDYYVDFGKWILEGEYRQGDNWKAGPDIAMYGFQQFVVYHYFCNHPLIKLIEPGVKIEYLNKNPKLSDENTWHYIPCIGFHFLNTFRFQMNLIYGRLHNGDSITKFAAQLQYKFL